MLKSNLIKQNVVSGAFYSFLQHLSMHFCLVPLMWCIHGYFFPSHSCLGGTDNVKHVNEIDLFDAIDENVMCTDLFSYFTFLFRTVCSTGMITFVAVLFTPRHRNPNKNAQTAQFCAIYEKHSQERRGQG